MKRERIESRSSTRFRSVFLGFFSERLENTFISRFGPLIRCLFTIYRIGVTERLFSQQVVLLRSSLVIAFHGRAIVDYRAPRKSPRWTIVKHTGLSRRVAIKSLHIYLSTFNVCVVFASFVFFFYFQRNKGRDAQGEFWIGKGKSSGVHVILLIFSMGLRSCSHKDATSIH